MACVEREVETKYGVAKFKIFACESCGKEGVNTNFPADWFRLYTPTDWQGKDFCSADCVRTQLASYEAKPQG